MIVNIDYEGQLLHVNIEVEKLPKRREPMIGENRRFKTAFEFRGHQYKGEWVGSLYKPLTVLVIAGRGQTTLFAKCLVAAVYQAMRQSGDIPDVIKVTEVHGADTVKAMIAEAHSQHNVEKFYKQMQEGKSLYEITH